MNKETLPALRVSQLTVNYEKTPVLWDISLEIPRGKLIGIMGPNGSGKSTFVKTILGLTQPLSGKVELLGLPLKLMRRKIAYIPQRESVDWDFPVTVRDLVLMGCYGRLGLFRRPGSEHRLAADGYLDMIGMLPYANRQINQLSGGQQQRVFIARALMQEADIYFMDEPFIGIDVGSETVIMSVLRRLRDEGKTVFLVHHDLNTVENYFDMGILLNLRLVAYGEIKDIFNPQYLHATFGKSYALFDEALKLSQQKTAGK